MRFSTKPAEVVVYVLLFTLFSSLGVWQLKRADEKRGIQNRINARGTQPALNLTGSLKTYPESLQYRKVIVEGEFIQQGQLLIDNIMLASRPGYHVITPLKISGTDQYVLVNRGWVGQKNKQRQPQEINTPAGPITVEGIIRTPSALPFVPSSVEPLSHNGEYNLWLYLDLEKYQQESPLKLLPIGLLQKNETGDGLLRDWPAYKAKVGMHLGYAIQWFAFAVIVTAIFISVGRRRAKKPV